MPNDKGKVFVVYGRNEKAKDAMYAFLRSIDLNPEEFSKAVYRTGKGAPYILEIIDKAFEDAQAVVVLITGDDIVSLSFQYMGGNFYRQARPNVFIEAGMALSRLPGKTILVKLDNNLLPTDLEGLHRIEFDGTIEKRLELANRLRSIGCLVNTDGTNWLNAGDFGGAINVSKNIEKGIEFLNGLLWPTEIFINFSPDMDGRELKMITDVVKREAAKLLEVPFLNDIVAFYAALKKEMEQCYAYIVIFRKELGNDIDSLGITPLEIEYICAFFKGVNTYVFALDEIKKHDAQDEETVFMKIRRICNMQRGSRCDKIAYSKIDYPKIDYYTDCVDLLAKLENLLLKLKDSRLDL